MKILSIDTASNISTVAVLENENCIKEIIIDDSRNHSEKIMPLIEHLIVCDKGPGSFTGIRIGVGTVLAFQDSLNIECVGISSLEALSYNTKNEGIICSLIDAKNNNVYYGLFSLENNEYTQIVALLKTYTSPITFVGDGAILNKEYLENNLQNCVFCDKNDLSSLSLGIAGYNKYKKGIQTTVMPLYLRKSQAERALEEKGGKN